MPNNNTLVVLKLIFLCVRVLTTVASNQWEIFVRLMRRISERVNQLRGEDSKSAVTTLIDEYLSFTLQLKNLWMSDVSHWSPNRFEDRIGANVHKGKVAVITGADRDIGQCSALILAKYGFKVIMGVKNADKTNDEIAKWTKSHDNYQMIAFELKTSSLKSVREFAKKVLESEPNIDLLVNSAERLIGRPVVTEEGFERHFVENYLGHFLLTNLLLESLKKSSNGRVINVSDVLLHIGTIDFDDLLIKKGYNFWTAFGRSKLAQVLFTKELAKRLKGTNVTTYAMSPNCLRNWKPLPHRDGRHVFNGWFARMSNPINGSQTVLYLALREDLKEESGYFYNNCERIEYMSNRTDQTSEMLWKVSEDLVKKYLD